MTFKKVIYLSWVLILGMIIWVSTNQSSICNQYKSIYSKELKGLVIEKKMIIQGGRPVGFLKIKSNDTVYTFDWCHIYSVYNNISNGDSIYKGKNSANLEFYRNGTFLGIMLNDCTF